MVWFIRRGYLFHIQPSENVGTYAAYFAALCTVTFEVERERVVDETDSTLS